MGWTRLKLAIGISLVCGFVFLIFFRVLLPSPPTLSFIEARVETLTYLVVNPEMSRFRAQGVIRRSNDPPGREQGVCINKDIMPKLHSRVTYTLRPGEPLTIEVTEPDDPNGAAEPLSYAVVADSERCPCTAASIAEEADRCPAAGPVRLPIRGPGALGSLLGAADDSRLLLTGTLSVYGRSMSGGSLYPVFDEPIPLPGGSVLSTLGGDISPPEAALVGFAEPAGDSLAVSVTTESRNLELSPPGGAIRPIPIEVGIFARLFQDPQILYWQVYLLVFLFLFQLAASGIELVKKKSTPGIPAKVPGNPGGTPGSDRTGTASETSSSAIPPKTPASQAESRSR